MQISFPSTLLSKSFAWSSKSAHYSLNMQIPDSLGMFPMLLSLVEPALYSLPFDCALSGLSQFLEASPEFFLWKWLFFFWSVLLSCYLHILEVAISFFKCMSYSPSFITTVCLTYLMYKIRILITSASNMRMNKIIQNKNLVNISEFLLLAINRKGTMLCTFFLIFILYWGVVGLQCCVNFRCTAKWFSYTCTFSILLQILFYVGYYRITYVLFYVGYYRILGRVPCTKQ